jgi:hypothetical protein
MSKNNEYIYIYTGLPIQNISETNKPTPHPFRANIVSTTQAKEVQEVQQDKKTCEVD